MPDKFIVNKDYNNSRFDRWFKEVIVNIPNSLIQKLLRKNKIKVNNKKIKSSFRLTEGDNVLVFNLSNYKATNLKKKYSIFHQKRKRIHSVIMLSMMGMIIL